METVALEMDDVFGEGLQEEEDLEQRPQMLPDLPEEPENDGQGTGNDDETENKKVLDKLKGMKGASKNTVKRPIPKLDSTRLIGERGIPILPRVFKDVKLKGKGHEVEDLRIIMRYLEHWGHRLFPKMPFDEVLERVERLGAKRDVQTCIKKMRQDMPVLGSDTVRRGEEEEEEEEEAANRIQSQPPKQNPSAEEMFDALLQEEQEMEAEMSSQRNAQAARGGSPEDTGSRTFSPSSKENRSSQRNAQAARGGSPEDTGSRTFSPSSWENKSSQPASSQNSASSEAASSSAALSSEVLERMERNRRLAMEKRAKKLGIPVTSLSQQGSPVALPSSKERVQEDAAHTTSQTEPAQDTLIENDTQVSRDASETCPQESMEISEEHAQNLKETSEECIPDPQPTSSEECTQGSEETSEERALEMMETEEEHITPDSKETTEEQTLEGSAKTSEEQTQESQILDHAPEENTTPDPGEVSEECAPDLAEASELTPGMKIAEECTPDLKETSEEQGTVDSDQTSEEQTLQDAKDA